MSAHETAVDARRFFRAANDPPTTVTTVKTRLEPPSFELNEAPFEGILTHDRDADSFIKLIDPLDDVVGLEAPPSHEATPDLR
jgi:hypothetical protein